VGLAQAQAALDAVARRLAQAYPDTNKGVKALAFRELDTHPEVYTARGANLVAVLFLALGAVVLIVACANLANLMLARAAARRKEIALRLALGAGRGRLVRQFVTEATVLSLLAGALGLCVAGAATRAVSSISLPTDIPLAFDVAMDWRVLLFTLGLSLAAGLAFGLAPALGSSRPALVPALKGAETTRQGRRRRVTVASGLMAAQVAFSLVLLVAAGLFWKSVGGTSAVDPGMRLSSRALVSFSPALLRYDSARSAAFYRALAERVREAPEIRSAGLVGWVPLGFQASERRLVIRGIDVPEGRMRSLDTVVTPGYF
jgi:predicted lysophospholipase L1 biosynthesis ABC-type transport system permease subunit